MHLPSACQLVSKLRKEPIFCFSRQALEPVPVWNLLRWAGMKTLQPNLLSFVPSLLFSSLDAFSFFLLLQGSDLGLPSDLLSVILSHLPLRNRIACKRVCKAWNKAVPAVPFPLAVASTNSTKSCTHAARTLTHSLAHSFTITITHSHSLSLFNRAGAFTWDVRSNSAADYALSNNDQTFERIRGECVDLKSLFLSCFSFHVSRFGFMRASSPPAPPLPRLHSRYSLFSCPRRRWEGVKGNAVFTSGVHAWKVFVVFSTLRISHRNPFFSS